MIGAGFRANLADPSRTDDPNIDFATRHSLFLLRTIERRLTPDHGGTLRQMPASIKFQ
jgi:hypothetical protein